MAPSEFAENELPETVKAVLGAGSTGDPLNLIPAPRLFWIKLLLTDRLFTPPPIQIASPEAPGSDVPLPSIVFPLIVTCEIVAKLTGPSCSIRFPEIVTSCCGFATEPKNETDPLRWS